MGAIKQRRKIMNKRFLLILPALGLLLAACTPTNQGNTSSEQVSPVTGVEVDHESLELQVGQTAQLAASVKPISLDDREVTWSSDNAEVASVDASGMVTAVAQGTAKIKATAHADENKFAECAVTVTPRMVTIPKLTAAEVMAATEDLKLGANQKNVGAYYYFTGSVDSGTRGETSVSWAEGVSVKLEAATAANKYYVSFTKDNAKKYFEMDDVHHYAIVDTPTAGREWDWNETYATVQRTISGQSDSKNNGTFLPGTYNTYTTVSGCNLDQAANDFFFQFVYQALPVAPTAITVKAAANKIYQGGTLQMEAELAPLAAEGKVVWSVTGDEKVTIDQNGLLTAAADATLNGTVTVKAAYDKDATIFGTKDITVAELINYGTLQNPLTIAQAKAVIDKFAEGELTGEKIFVKGFVSLNHKELDNGTKRDNLWLASDDGSEQKAFELYSVYADESLFADGATSVPANSLVGKEVIAEGWGMVYVSGSNKTYEFSAKNAANEYDNGYVRAVTSNVRTATGIELDPKEAFEIEQGSNKAVSAVLTPYGAAGAITFAVAPANQGVSYADGKVVATETATVGSYTLTATSGSLTKSVAFSVKAAAQGTKATLDMKAYATANNIANQTKISSIAIDSVVTAKASGTDANTGKVYIGDTYTEWRFYKSGTGTLTIELAAGYTLVSAKGQIGTANYGEPSEVVFTVANNKVTYNPGANFNVKSLEIIYTAAQ